MLFEKIDEFAHFGLVRSKLARPFGNFDEAIAIARFFHFGKQEVKHDKIEVLDFVCATFDKLARRHERGHVSAYAKSPNMRMISDDGNKLRFD